MKKQWILLIVICLWVISYTPKNNTIQVDTSEAPIMYLTFDDGPNDYTVEILSILKKYDIKATFFVTATRPDCFYLIKEAYRQGHTIGLHAYRHDYSVIYSSVDAYFSDLEKISEVVEREIGKKSYYIRFPGGSSNRVSEINMYELIKELKERGYRYFDWNGESGDAKKGSDTLSVMLSSMQGVDGKRDIMMLCHDKKVMVEVLPTIIEFYLELGYVFLPINEGTPGFCHLK